MKIEFERIDKLPHYTISSGTAYIINAEPINVVQNYANVEIENTTAHEQQKKRSVTSQQLKDAIENAQNIGHKGEEFINYYLEQQEKLGLINKFIWEANTNATAPYDFVIIEQNGSETFIDVKSTESDFSNSIHISYNELLEVVKREYQYHIYRIYAMTDSKAQLRIIEGLSDFAKGVIKILEGLPEYVKPDGIALSLSNLKFGDEITIYRIDVKEQSI